MAGKTIPWWQRVIVGAFRGLRAGVAALLKPAKKIEEPTTLVQEQGKNQGKTLTEDSPQVKPDVAPETEPVAKPPAEIAEEIPAMEPEEMEPEAAGGETPADAQDVDTVQAAEAATMQSSAETAKAAAEAAELAELPESPADLLAEAALGTEPAQEPEPEAVRQELAPEIAEEAAALEPAQEELDEPATEAEAPEIEEVEEAFEREEAEERPSAHREEEQAEKEASTEEMPAPELAHEPSDDQTAGPGQAIEETIVTPEIETEATAQEPDLEESAEVLVEEESEEDLPAEEMEAEEAAPAEEAQPADGAQPANQPSEAVADERAQPELAQPEAAQETAPTESAENQPEPAISAEHERPAAPELPAKAAAAPPQAAAPQVAQEPIKREQGPDTSPVSVLVSQVYEGPFDLLLDLIRKQDIDIYDIPIAKITAQFLAYVNKLKASDMDVAGEFIYTASLLIHIKSKMLLPREPSGAGEEQEDPRRELVERLLEHERFKNAAQMLQQKQMLEAATWTNPGMREFRDDAGAEPEIAADTVDLVRVFREILDRARNRPVLNLEEDAVTVGQMIQFLGRRMTMEDKPVALRRLLAHTKSERALIAMFLALLELVRLQAILLRQDKHFSEIFIKKNSGFDAVINEGMARDDWQ